MAAAVGKSATTYVIHVTYDFETTGLSSIAGTIADSCVIASSQGTGVNKNKMLCIRPRPSVLLTAVPRLAPHKVGPQMDMKLGVRS